MIRSLFKRKSATKTSMPTEEITFVPEPILDSDPTIDRICQFLREEGYVPSKQSDNLAVFKIQGETYYTCWQEESRWASIRKSFDLEEEDILSAMIAAHDIMTHWALIRIYVDENDQDITFSVEQFCDSMDEYRPFFNRALSIINADLGFFTEAFDEARAKRNEISRMFLLQNSIMQS